MRKKRGLRDNLHLLTTDDLAVFHCTSQAELAKLIETTLLGLINQDKQSSTGKKLRALAGALGFAEKIRATLAERRHEMAVELGVTERTLQRWEKDGAKFLAGSLPYAWSTTTIDEQSPGAEQLLLQIQATLSEILAVLREMTHK